MFQPFQTLQVQLQKPTFLHHSFSKFRAFSAFFSTLFHCSSSKFTTTTAQFQFYNCKLHFTTAQIVISCTLKYAQLSGINNQLINQSSFVYLTKLTSTQLLHFQNIPFYAY